MNKDDGKKKDIKEGRFKRSPVKVVNQSPLDKKTLAQGIGADPKKPVGPGTGRVFPLEIGSQPALGGSDPQIRPEADTANRRADIYPLPVDHAQKIADRCQKGGKNHSTVIIPPFPFGDQEKKEKPQSQPGKCIGHELSPKIQKIPLLERNKIVLLWFCRG